MAANLAPILLNSETPNLRPLHASLCLQRICEPKRVNLANSMAGTKPKPQSLWGLLNLRVESKRSRGKALGLIRPELEHAKFQELSLLILLLGTDLIPPEPPAKELAALGLRAGFQDFAD